MKGQGLSITTIVVAAISLLILVVLVAVFTGQFGKFSQGINSCESRSGKLSGSCSSGSISLPGNWGDGKVCCINPNFKQTSNNKNSNNPVTPTPIVT